MPWLFLCDKNEIFELLDYCFGTKADHLVNLSAVC